MATILSPVHFLGWANDTRVRLAELLAQHGELTVVELTRRLKISQPRVSWHLRILRQAQIVKTRRSGREVYCSLDIDSIRRHQDHLARLLSGYGSREINTAPGSAPAREVT